MRGFRREDETYVAELDEVEREVVARLATDVAELLGATPAQLAAAQEHVDDPWAAGEPSVEDRLAGLVDSTAAEPLDPALRRLLPTASEDAEVAAEFRRLTQVDLRAVKIGRLLALARALRQAGDGRLVVPRERADLLSAALVDVRLVLAERLGVEDDSAAEELYAEIERAEDDPPATTSQAVRLHLVTAYAALTWLQESLVTLRLAELDGPEA